MRVKIRNFHTVLSGKYDIVLQKYSLHHDLDLTLLVQAQVQKGVENLCSAREKEVYRSMK